MIDIFLSYSSSDRERVRLARDALTGAGYRVFWDQETPAGVNWSNWIKERLDEARLVLVFWSRNSVISDPVCHEAKIAHETGKLVPCQLEVLAARDFPLGLYSIQTASLDGWLGQAGHAGFQSLLNDLRKRLGQDPETLASAMSAIEAKDVAVLSSLASEGEAWAQLQLGCRYQQGLGVKRDEREALRLYRQAADQGYAPALSNLALMYELGLGGLRRDDREAVRLYRLAADQGHAVAQQNLGSLYKEGGGGLQQDDVEAVRLFRLAAKQKLPAAACSLAVMYEQGRGGLPKNDEEALRFYAAAAEGGDARAQCNLGAMYYRGSAGLTRDVVKAAEWFRRGANGGHDIAQFNLARLLERGVTGIAQNEAEANRLYELSAAQGYGPALEVLKARRHS